MCATEKAAGAAPLAAAKIMRDELEIAERQESNGSGRLILRTASVTCIASTGLSPGARSRATENPVVASDRTHTGRLP